MYGYGPTLDRPTLDPASAGPGTLCLRQVRRRDFAGPGAPAPVEAERAFLDEYLSDLARPYGFPTRPEVLAGGGDHRYEELAETLIADLVPPTRPVDLVVLAFAVPDVRAGRTVATWRGRACPGDPLTFAVCDQGSAAAFTGLRLIRELARTGGCRRGLLLVVEQPVLAYQPTVPTALPARPVAVGLLFDGTGPARLIAERQYPDVGPEAVADRLATGLAQLRAGADPVRLVLGAGLAAAAVDVAPTDRVRVAPAGQPSTGGWWALADELSAPDTGEGAREAAGARGAAGVGERRRVVLADYDPTLGYLCLAAFDPR